MDQVSWVNRLTVMLKWSKGYEWDNKIQMQNLLNLLRINELEATHLWESRRKKISMFPPEQVQLIPCALLSSSRMRTSLFSWRGLESYSPLWQEDGTVLRWTGPRSKLTGAAAATGPQADAHPCHRAATCPSWKLPMVPDGSRTPQSTTDLSQCIKCNGLSLQPVILFISLLHENLLKKNHHYNHK